MNKAVCGCGRATVNKCVTQNKKAVSTAYLLLFSINNMRPVAFKSPNHHVWDI